MKLHLRSSEPRINQHNPFRPKAKIPASQYVSSVGGWNRDVAVLFTTWHLPDVSVLTFDTSNPVPPPSSSNSIGADMVFRLLGIRMAP